MNRPTIVGVMGLARNGKDTVANILERKFSYTTVAFADPIKRLCMQVYDFSVEQVWGPQEVKEAPDMRYPRDHSWEVDPAKSLNPALTVCRCCRAVYGKMPHPQCYLTPRYAMQIIGTEGGRHCYHATWEQLTMRIVRSLTTQGGFFYTRIEGLTKLRDDANKDYRHIVSMPDVRFGTEMESIQRHGGIVIRVRRPGFDIPAFAHASETEQMKIHDDRLQGVIINDGSLEDLEHKVCHLIEGFGHELHA